MMEYLSFSGTPEKFFNNSIDVKMDYRKTY